MDLNKGIVFLIVMLLAVNFGSIIRLHVFGSCTWKEIKIIMIIGDIIVIFLFILYYVFNPFKAYN